MGNVLNPNFLNIPEQVEANTRKLEGSKIYKTTLNLTSGTSSIPIETTNIDDIKKVIEDSVIFSANGLMFLIKAFTKNSVLVEFYSDLSSVNYLITKFDFETENIIYQDDSSEFKGIIKYNDDELTGEKIAPATIKLKIKGGNQITIDVDESGKILIVKIDEDFLSQLEETIELSNENAQQLQRCLKIPISSPENTELVGVGTNNAQVMIALNTLGKSDLSNVTYPTNTPGITQTGAGDRVIETYISSDGLTWYRKWASGWKECGGIGDNIGGSSIGSKITLPIIFSNTKYTLLTTIFITTDSKDSSVNSVIPLNITQDSFNVSLQYATGENSGYFAGKIKYYCCGY